MIVGYRAATKLQQIRHTTLNRWPSRISDRRPEVIRNPQEGEYMYLVRTAIHKSGIEGDGIFAGEFIPKGTIVYFYSSDDIFVPLDSFLFSSEAEKNRFLNIMFKMKLAIGWLKKIKSTTVAMLISFLYMLTASTAILP